ncbi:MAG: hypothetical protein COA83_10990 [Methylophaga sp.]|nr:MAG: hypothetical protein COA83_10990 [Methylophaga sp.]
MPTNNKYSSEILLTLLGQQVIYQSKKCEIIELLDGCELVLQVLEEGTSIQATQYGEGHRNVPATYILSIFDGEGNLHADLISAGLGDLLKRLCNNS